MNAAGGSGRPYPPEFKEQAVRLFEESGRPFKEVADQIGVADQTLRNWVAQAQVDRGDKAGLSTEERAELRALRKKTKALEEENAFLKKASAFFAAETDKHRKK